MSTQDSAPGVMVSLAEIYRMQLATERRLEQLCTALDERDRAEREAAEQRQRQDERDRAERDATLDDHETRLRTMERRTWMVSGGSAVLAAALTGGVVQGLNAVVGG